MSRILKKHTWLKTRSELPGRLEIDRVYFIADEGVFLLDHGAGPVEFGSAGGGGVESLDRGMFETAAALRAAHPTDVLGAFATVLDTMTLWIWNGADWADSGKPPAEIVIVDNLTTAAANKALSARQGMILNGKIGEQSERIDALEDLALSVDEQGYMCQTIEEE